MDEQLTPAEFAQLRRLKPAEAMQWMQERSHTALTFAWEDLLHEEHSRHFTISRLARLDLLQSLHAMLLKSVGGDLSRRDWQADAEKLLADAGWWGEKEVLDPATGKMVKTTFNPQRLGLILDVNTRQAAASGSGRAFSAPNARTPTCATSPNATSACVNYTQVGTMSRCSWMIRFGKPITHPTAGAAAAGSCPFRSVNTMRG